MKRINKKTLDTKTKVAEEMNKEPVEEENMATDHLAPLKQMSDGQDPVWRTIEKLSFNEMVLGSVVDSVLRMERALPLGLKQVKC